MVYESRMRKVSTHMNHNEAWRGYVNLVRNTTINIITLTWFKYNAYAEKIVKPLTRIKISWR